MKNLTLLALALLAAAPLEAQRDQYDWSGSIPAGATLRVATGAGNVTVTRAQGATARVRGELRRRGSEGEGVRFEMVRAGRDVIVCALVSARATCTARGLQNESYRGRRQPRADFTVELPAGVVMNASSGTGDVDVSGATAVVSASTGNGSVRVAAGAAEVSAATGNGSVRVDDARGAVRAASGNGRIDVSAAGPVTASSGNGDIQVSIASPRAAGDMAFNSGNGSITLRLPDGFGAELDATSGSGSISSDFEVRTTGRLTRGRLRGTLGNGGRALRVATGNGRVSLERAR